MAGSSNGCIFCGANRKLSNEHVIPRWVTKSFELSGEVTLYATERGEPPHEVHSRDHLLLMLRKSVCEVCNNTWMSELE